MVPMGGVDFKKTNLIIIKYAKFVCKFYYINSI